MNALAARNGPDVRLPLVHVLTGVMAAVLGGVALVLWGPGLLAQPIGDLQTLAATHLFTLGWLAMTIVGATYQLIPVVVEVRLRSEALAWAGYPLLLCGMAAMVTGFATVRLPVIGAGAAAAITALVLYAGHALSCVGRAGPRTRTAARFVQVSAGYLLLLCLAGGLLAASLSHHVTTLDLLPAHVAVALLGWATVMAIGTGYHLTPMFALSHGGPADHRTTVLPLVAVGTAVLLLALVLDWPPAVCAAVGLVPAAAAVTFAWDQRTMLGTRGRPMDTGLRLTALAAAYLVAVTIVAELALAGLWQPGHGLVVLLCLLGWLGCLIAGQTYRIVPFLVWYRRYGPRAGREKVPLLREMYDTRIAAAVPWLLGLAACVLGAGAISGQGLLMRAGACCWLFGYGTLAWNMVQVLLA